MLTIREPAELTRAVKQYRAQGETISFVPTMGALHPGHLSLVQTARTRAQRVVVSIFVNPTQFGPNEDYLRYPRPEAKDLELLEKTNTDLAYLPSVSAIYQPGATVTVDPGSVGRTFEGGIRPDHFRGVLTIVAKLFHQVQPHVAVFGQKDAQQLFLVRQMVCDLNYPIEIVEAATMREEDGLAMSSRNAYLKHAERSKASILYRALMAGKSAIESGVHSLTHVRTAMADVLAVEPDIAADYLTAVSNETFAELDPIAESSRLIGAIRLGSVRLIDNIPVNFS